MVYGGQLARRSIVATFQAGRQVKWHDSAGPKLRGMKAAHGAGPFVVKDVTSAANMALRLDTQAGKDQWLDADLFMPVGPPVTKDPGLHTGTPIESDQRLRGHAQATIGGLDGQPIEDPRLRHKVRAALRGLIHPEGTGL